MSIAAFIPIKSNSERVKGKNFRVLNGKNFMNILQNMLLHLMFLMIFILIQTVKKSQTMHMKWDVLQQRENRNLLSIQQTATTFLLTTLILIRNMIIISSCLQQHRSFSPNPSRSASTNWYRALNTTLASQQQQITDSIGCSDSRLITDPEFFPEARICMQ